VRQTRSHWNRTCSCHPVQTPQAGLRQVERELTKQRPTVIVHGHVRGTSRQATGIPPGRVVLELELELVLEQVVVVLPGSGPTSGQYPVTSPLLEKRCYAPYRISSRPPAADTVGTACPAPPYLAEVALAHHVSRCGARCVQSRSSSVQSNWLGSTSLLPHTSSVVVLSSTGAERPGTAPQLFDDCIDGGFGLREMLLRPWSTSLGRRNR
jgi:hypothetical protein